MGIRNILVENVYNDLLPFSLLRLLFRFSSEMHVLLGKGLGSVRNFSSVLNDTIERTTVTANSKHESVPRDQVCPLPVFYCSLLLNKNYKFHIF